MEGDWFMSFAKRANAAIETANGDKLFIGVVCRLNGDDDLIVETRNDGYGLTPSTPVASSNKVTLRQDMAQHIKPVRQILTAEYEPLFIHPAVREARYWMNLEESIKSGQGDYSMEATNLYRTRYVKIGLAGPEWYAKAEETVREEALQRVTAKTEIAKKEWQKVKSVGKDFDTEGHTAMVDKEYDKLSGTATDYPGEYVQVDTDGGFSGGHAEENLLRVWTGAIAGLKLAKVEIFVTRGPCPDNSSGMRINGHTYKEGCINKLIQLVDKTAGVDFDISYYQALSTDQQALMDKWAQRGFPSNRVHFHHVTHF